MENDEQLARGLGWFSIGLGLAQVLAPGDLARFIGIKDSSNSRAMLRAVGIREIVSGIGILTKQRPVEWVQARVAGDAMDLALLGMALCSGDNDQGRVATATAAVVGVTVLDMLCTKQLTEHSSSRTGSRREKKDMDVKLAITISRPAEELYQFWHNFENLPRFMNHLEAVQVTGDKHSHWKAKAPAGTTVEWDAETIDDQPNQQIAWRSLPGADVDNSGSVSFERAPGDRGTVVRVEMRYNPPGGALGTAVAKLFGEDPEKQVWEDLHRFKQIMEVGEVVRSEGSPEGMGSPQRPAQHPVGSTAG